MSTDCDLLIVGAGPAGLSVAGALDPKINTIILHQDAQIGLPVRTSGGTFLRDMQALGIPPHFYQAIDQIDFFSDGEEARFAVENDKMAVLDITGLYRYLARLSDSHDRDLRCGHKLVGIARADDGFTAQVRSRETGDYTIRARRVVDASGWHMAALSALGLVEKPGRLGIGTELEFDRGDYPENRAILFVGSDALHGYGWVFPAPGGRLRLGVGVLQPDTDASPREMMERLTASGGLDRYGVTVPEDVVVQGGIVPSVSFERRVVFDGIYRVGDTANLATPTAGEGIRQAIHYGRMLGQALSASNPKAALRAYERAMRRDLARDYWIGLHLNRRIARYAAADWDRSVRRLARLSEDQMTTLLRSRFSVGGIAQTLWRSVLHKLRG